MNERIEVICVQGVFRPVQPLPPSVKDNQRYLVSLEPSLPVASLEEVRNALAKVQGTLASYVSAERDAR